MVVLGGEQTPDAALMELSTVPIGVAADAHVYLAQGGPENLRQLHAFLSDTVLLTGEGFDPPVDQPAWGLLRAEPSRRTAQGDIAAGGHPLLPGPVHRREHRVRRGPGRRGRRGGRASAYRSSPPRCATPRPTCSTTSARSTPWSPRCWPPAAPTRPRRRPVRTTRRWDVRALAALDIPILQGLCLTWDRASWADSDEGMTPLDVATQVAVPEFDGRIITVPFSFKETDADGLPAYVPDSRALPPGRRHRGRTTPGSATSRRPSARSRSCCRRTRPSTRGSATPSAWTPRSPLIRLLRAMREAGYDLGAPGEIPGHRRARAGRGREPGHHRRQRPDPRPHRGRRPGRGMADRRAAERPAGADPRRDLPRLAGRAARRAERRGHRGLGCGAGRAVRRPDARPRGRDRRRHPAGRQRRHPGPAAARLRREPDRDLPRPGPGAVAPLPGDLPVDRAGVRRARRGPPRQARQPGVAARQERRACPRPAAPTRRSARCR